ncbi:hypothetical protein PENSPDRAFT_49450 [Peniophora sp. CONT]|nr:hypothetical protein PENSPDRAFT_49450 [Peniophora sp. CONT]
MLSCFPSLTMSILRRLRPRPHPGRPEGPELPSLDDSKFHDDVASSSLADDPSGSLEDFDLWNSALEEYRLSLDVDLRDQTVSFIRELEQASTCDDILDVLQDTSECLSAKRRGHKLSRALRKALKPVINGLSAILNAGAETAAAVGVPGGKGIFAAVAVLLQAADRVSATYDSLAELFQHIRAYIERLQVKKGVIRTPVAQMISVRALVEVLKALELATKMMRGTRFQHFWRAIFSTSNAAQSALKKFENVVTEEERMAIAQLLARVDEISSEVAISTSWLAPSKSAVD